MRHIAFSYDMLGIGIILYTLLYADSDLNFLRTLNDLTTISKRPNISKQGKLF
jgi:hypothetical protein